MRIDGYLQDAPLEELAWVADLNHFFRFRAGTIEVWQVGYQPTSLFLSVSDPLLSRRYLYR